MGVCGHRASKTPAWPRLHNKYHFPYASAHGKSFWLDNGGEAGQTLTEASAGEGTVELTSQISMPGTGNTTQLDFTKETNPLSAPDISAQPSSSVIPGHWTVFKEEPTALTRSHQLRESTPWMSRFGLCEAEQQHLQGLAEKSTRFWLGGISEWRLTQWGRTSGQNPSTRHMRVNNHEGLYNRGWLSKASHGVLWLRQHHEVSRAKTGRAFHRHRTIETYAFLSQERV